ncbi:MAG: hypothetical protein ACK5H2_12040 [Beutenbergiaceae bacterium]
MSLDTLPPPGQFKTTEEIRDAQFANELRRKRKLMLAWSAPVMLLVLLVSLKMLSAVGLNMAGTSAYQQANHNTAAQRFEALEFFNVIQPWKAYFNQGTAIYASGDFWNASQELEIALDMVPKAPPGEPPGREECDVRTNLSLAYEGLGDEALAVSDAAMAASRYNEAQEVLSNCGESDGNGGEEAQEAEERQQESQEQAEEQQQQQQDSGQDPSPDPSTDPSQSPGSGDPSTDPSQSQSSGEGGQSQSPTESADPRQEELESRNGEAGQSQDASEQASGGGNGSGQNW